jgi:hypothetical protein
MGSQIGTDKGQHEEVIGNDYENPRRNKTLVKTEADRDKCL